MCNELSNAVDSGKLGDTVRKVQELILQYYGDVQRQAQQSFASARVAARIGFGVLIATLLYVFAIDLAPRLGVGNAGEGIMQTVPIVGVVSGALIEFIAAVAFWLYSRTARQFGAFHVCLERTHRYLLAYKVAEQVSSDKSATLRDLVCIMANAPMISAGDPHPDLSETRKSTQRNGRRTSEEAVSAGA